MNKIKEFLSDKVEMISEQEEIKRKDPIDCVISLAFEDGHIHTHTTDNVDDIIKEMGCQCKMEEYSCIEKIPKKVPKKIIFRNRQAIGDILTMTCSIRDFKKASPDTQVQVQTTAMHIWDNNPYIDHGQPFDDIEPTKIGTGILTNQSNRKSLHMCNAFRMSMEDTLGISIPQGLIKPDIWLTEEEFYRDPIIKGHYWVIIVGGEPGWTAKMYPEDRWQEVIDSLPDIQFVQLGVKSHPFKHLNNVIDFIGKTEDRHTGIRDLFNIFMHAQGSIGLVSMHMHLSAAFNNPAMVVAGAREPMHFTHYMGHQYLQTNGCLPCAEKTACWKCDIKGCLDQKDGIPKCIDIITSNEIVAVINKYYEGGRLKLGEKKKIDFTNIVKEKKVFQVPKTKQIDNDLLKKYGFEWGGGSITDKDWVFMNATIDKYNIKTVLEFGVGLSSLLMANKVNSVLTYETNQNWIDKVDNMGPDTLKIRKWDGKIPSEPILPPDGQSAFDLAFVDGPAGGENREKSIQIASTLANLVIVHDAGRVPERKWQEKHLRNYYDLISKGGHRCHLWKKKVKKQPKDKIARVITTCRGFGGSERSTIMIMKMLQERGYDVELIPFGNICQEYAQNMPDNVDVFNWEKVWEKADISIMYCSDSIWNFEKEEWVNGFGRWNSDRRVMILNYQLGGSGKVDWTKGWDKYMFLNSTKESEFLLVQPNAKTKVLAPPTDLTEFFKVKIDYGTNLRLIRHNSQGDAKHPEYTNKMICDVLDISPDIEFFYMPARSDTIYSPNIYPFKRNEIPIAEFLSLGNCFWYHLPPDYQDQGPRVVLEALAAGLPVIADNRYGAKERITDDTGWLCDSYDDYLETIKQLTPSILAQKGEAARDFAKKEFDPYRWVEEIII